MKKMFFMALVAGSMLFTSCAKMSPEATAAWNDFKEKAALVSTDEAVDQFESIEDYQAAFDAAMNAGTEFGTNFDGKVTQEIADSFATMSQNLIAMDQKVQAHFAEMAAAEAEEEAEEGEEVEE